MLNQNGSKPGQTVQLTAANQLLPTFIPKAVDGNTGSTKHMVVQTMIQHPNGTQQLVQYTLPETSNPQQIILPWPAASSQHAAVVINSKPTTAVCEQPVESQQLSSEQATKPKAAAGGGGGGGFQLGPTPAQLGIAKGIARRNSSKSSTGQETPSSADTPLDKNSQQPGQQQFFSLVTPLEESNTPAEGTPAAPLVSEPLQIAVGEQRPTSIEKTTASPAAQVLPPAEDPIPASEPAVQGQDFLKPHDDQNMAAGCELKSPTKKLFKRKDESMDK